MTIINLGTITDEGFLVYQVNFDLERIANQYELAIKCENFSWNQAIIRDSHRIRMQIVDAGKYSSSFMGATPQTTSANAMFGLVELGSWSVEGSIMGKPGQEVKLVIKYLQDASIVESFQSFINETQNDYTNYLSQEDMKNYGTQWYKGDLHTHTILSDGQMTITDNQAQAKIMNLDYYVATEHNIVPTQWQMGDHLSTVYPGVEITSHLGHFNLLFARRSPFEYHSIHDLNTPEGMMTMISSIQSQELGMVSINHPFLTVWKWQLISLDLDSIDCIEIMNDPTYQANQVANLQTLKFWDAILNDGRFIPIVGGSDSHLRPEDRYDGSEYPSLIGDPGTYIYAENNTAKSLQTAIREGHVVVSRFGFLEVVFGEYLPGTHVGLDAIPETGLEVVVNYHSENQKIPTIAEVIVDGEVLFTSELQTFTYLIQANLLREDYHWVRVQLLHAETSELIGVTNPIIIGEKKCKFTTWDDVLKVVPDTTPDQ